MSKTRIGASPLSKFLLLVLLSGVSLTAVSSQEAPSKPIRRVAVMDFRNLTGDHKLDGLTLGIPTTIEREIGTTSLLLVERQGLDLALREMSLARKQLISASSAPQTGKWVGVDSLILGEFQKQNDQIHLNARVMDVETGVVRASVSVDGTYTKLFIAQAELAKKLVIAIQGAVSDAQRKKLASEDRSIEAFQAFSDGLLFLRKNLPADALNKFDLTLAIDPGYAGALYYRAVALQGLHRLDEARDALKQALPRSQPEQQVLWQTSAAGRPSFALDFSQAQAQRDYFAKPTSASREREAFYAEHPAKGTTVLHTFDAKEQRFNDLEVAEDNVSTTVSANDQFIVVVGYALGSSGPERMTFYLFSRADHKPAWHTTVDSLGGKVPRYGLIGNAFYIHVPGSARIDLYDAQSGERRWTAARPGIAVDPMDPPMLRHTQAFDDILILKSGTSYRAIRMSDGNDAWSVTAQGDKTSELANDHLLVVFEPERRVFIVDLESGKTLKEFPIPQLFDALPGIPKWIVGALLDESQLYVQSKDFDLYALNLTDRSVSWRIPLQKRLQSMQAYRERLYLGMEPGELLVIDTAAGKILKKVEVTGGPVAVSNISDRGLIVRTDKILASFTLDGVKRWEYPWSNGPTETDVFGNVLTATWRTKDGSGLTALNLDTGKPLWQYPSPAPGLFTAADQLFVVEPNAIKQYSTGNISEALSEKQTLAKLAEVLLQQSDIAQAATVVQDAMAIDSNYPPAVLVHARLLEAQKSSQAAGQEFARYATLVGLQSRAGQEMLVELKRDRGLAWHTIIGTNVAGAPELLGNLLLSIGNRVAYESQVIALNADSGRMLWHRSGERFVASVTGSLGGRSYVWYTSGLHSDSNVVLLHRIDVQTGVSTEIARWKNTSRVNEASIAYDEGRIFVATTSPDVDKSSLSYEITAIDAGTKTIRWQKSGELKVNTMALLRPVTAFAARAGALEYVIGGEDRRISESDGSALAALAEQLKPAEPQLPASLLWKPAAFTATSDRLFVFTPDGTAYAAG